ATKKGEEEEAARIAGEAAAAALKAEKAKEEEAARKLEAELEEARQKVELATKIREEEAERQRLLAEAAKSQKAEAAKGRKAKLREDQTEKKCELKVKRLKELVADFPGSEVCRTLKELQAGDRSSVPLVVKVVSVLERPGEVPVIVICCDSSGDFFALSFYNAELQKLGQAVVPMKTLLSVSQASFRQVTVSGPGGKKLSYSSVAVANPADAVILSGGSAGSTGSSLALATGRSMVYSTGAENRSAENE
ncbi:unnamed protein product, partial [Polarella glacialis]